MLDTVTFVLHSMNEKFIDLAPDVSHGKSYKYSFNRLLYERLCEYESKYIERVKKFQNNNLIENPDDTYFLSKKEVRQGIVQRRGILIDNHDRGEMFFFPVSGNIQTASSDYRTKFKISENSDSIEFELSIPKYFYNHNIAQFVPNIDSKRYKDNPFSIREFYGQTDLLHQRLIEFIYTFFSDLANLLDMPDLAFDIHNIEIKRLDFCYNQIFPSYEMVLDFLTQQRKFYKSRLRKDTIIQDDRETSFYYRHSVDGFYFKIYAKYDEFKNVDLPKILKQNKDYFYQNCTSKNHDLIHKARDVFKTHFEKTFKNNSGIIDDLIFKYYSTYLDTKEHQQFVNDFETLLPFKISFLIEQSKKVLRYEMSFTRKYMSTLYKREIFRKKCPNWKELHKSYNHIKRYDLLLYQGRPQAAKDFKNKFLITDLDRRNYEVLDTSLHKKHEFYLVTDKKIQKHESFFVDAVNLLSVRNYKIKEIKEATLSPQLFKVLISKFKDEIDFFQVKQFKDTKTVLEQIDEYNLTVSKKIKNYKNAFGEKAFKLMKHTEKRKKGYSLLNKTRIKIAVDLMEKGKSLIEIKEYIGLSKSAYYQLQDDLKKFDIHKTTVKTKFNHNLIKTDFRDYYQLFHENSNFHRYFFLNPFLISFDTVRNIPEHFGIEKK